MRCIDADALIDDLKHDVAVDQDSLDYEELTDSNREKIQFDKDCKQNAIDLLQHAPTIEPERKTGIPRDAIEYILRKETVSTNPYNFTANEKFIKFMDDPEIASFGRWQHANGFNTALVAVKCDLDKIPDSEPQRKRGKWIPQNLNKSDGMISTAVYYYPKCSVCGANANYTNFCPNCGADMRTPVETARNIVHEAINNSVWSDTVDTANMHKVVDDKYAEIRG